MTIDPQVLHDFIDFGYFVAVGLALFGVFWVGMRMRK